MVGLYGDRKGAKIPIETMMISAHSAIIAERLLLNRAQINCP